MRHNGFGKISKKIQNVEKTIDKWILPWYNTRPLKTNEYTDDK